MDKNESQIAFSFSLFLPGYLFSKIFNTLKNKNEQKFDRE